MYEYVLTTETTNRGRRANSEESDLVAPAKNIINIVNTTDFLIHGTYFERSQLLLLILLKTYKNLKCKLIFKKPHWLQTNCKKPFNHTAHFNSAIFVTSQCWPDIAMSKSELVNKPWKKNFKYCYKSATNVAENRKTLFVQWNLNLKFLTHQTMTQGSKGRSWTIQATGYIEDHDDFQNTAESTSYRQSS